MSKVKKSEKSVKVSKPKKVKVDNTIMNIWVNNENDTIEQIKIPTKLRMEFIKLFGTEKISDKLPVEAWLYNHQN